MMHSRPTLHSPTDIKKVRPFPTADTKISPQRVLLFEKTAKIGNKDYLVEISRDKLHLFIIAFLIEKAKYYTMQIPIKQAFKLLLELDNSFDALIDLLYLNYDTLLLPDFLRTKFSPRHMGETSYVRTASHKDSSKYHGFDEVSDAKPPVSNNTSKLALSKNSISKDSLETKEEMKEVEKQSKPIHEEDQNPPSTGNVESPKGESKGR